MRKIRLYNTLLGYILYSFTSNLYWRLRRWQREFVRTQKNAHRDACYKGVTRLGRCAEPSPDLYHIQHWLYYIWYRVSATPANQAAFFGRRLEITVCKAERRSNKDERLDYSYSGFHN